MARTSLRKPKPDKVLAGKVQKKLSTRAPAPSERPEDPPALTRFSVGDRVTHPSFGDGNVTSIHDDKLTIVFEKAGTKVVVDGFVKRAR